MKYRTHSCGELRKANVGVQVGLAGWVSSIRHHGKVAFINLRDRYGITQILIKNDKLLDKIRELGHEWVILANGKVLARPKGMGNPDLPTGEIDVEASEIEVLSRSKVPPFVITDEASAKEELRLKYRYLDLRRYQMQKTLIFKSKLYQTTREYLHNQGFVNIETPILGRSTPEGARDFLVPSRLHPGSFYSLVQSPQIYKQLLMIAGFDKYYQLARCLRDEDQRKDRQLEHTQLDLELAFINEENVFELIEGLMKHVFMKLLNVQLDIPFKRMQYKEAIEKYGTEKPDIRYNLLLTDVSQIAKKSEFKIFKEAEAVKCIKWGGALSRKELEELDIVVKGYGLRLSWLKYKDKSFSGPICSFFSQELLKEFSVGNSDLSETLLFVAGNELRASLALGGVRNWLIEKYLSPKNVGADRGVRPKKYKFVWVTDFPMFERDETTGQIVPSHHTFVMPKEPKQLNNPESAIGRLYDLVLNGIELGSGSIRVHTRELQEKIMQIVGFNKEQRERNFGCLLEALEYGAPPHGGIALGLDRLAMTILNKKSIQDVIAFPKTLTGIGLLEGIPSEVNPAQLNEVHIKVKKIQKREDTTEQKEL